MKIRKPVERPQYEEVEVCDRCGEPMLQDEMLTAWQFDHLNMKVLLHDQCLDQVRAALRAALGLKPETT